MPDITLETADGQPFALNTLRGKPLLVVFWASTCDTCTQELPVLIRLHHEYAPQGLEIVGIVIYYDNRDNALALVNNRQIPYRILLDRDKKATQAFRNVHYNTPTTFLIAPNSSVVYRHHGRIDFNFIRQQLRKFSAEP
ncbi:MAG: TlpA disulfide reductase family protein [Gammaproteobacteria bacterium]|nr:TlpA disulfide reductase family protein [Gammaproteobacteria bacterium]